MGPDDMGRVLTEATIASLKDLWDAERGMMTDDQVRRVMVSEALVDGGETLLSLPTRIIKQLGLDPVGTRQVASSIGITESTMFDPVRLTIQVRDCTMDVLEVPDTSSPRIGRLAILHLDLVIDTTTRTLIGNPAHGGEHVYEMY